MRGRVEGVEWGVRCGWRARVARDELKQVNVEYPQSIQQIEKEQLLTLLPLQQFPPLLLHSLNSSNNMLSKDLPPQLHLPIPIPIANPDITQPNIKCSVDNIKLHR